ncbi:MAG: bifunctional oligoribonuclease/PAP phosphatase NrnA [Melioribacter sp.]|nr:bifunctional oligoribonuclease/PAP phosphatase NrnA [Melioribacter sp.]
MGHFKKLKKILLSHKKFLITSHVNPDADAICSELAAYLILKKLGKEVRIVNHSFTPYNLESLDRNKVIERYDENNHQDIFNDADVILVVDLNQMNRVVRMEKGLRTSNKFKVCIDHHQDPENVFDLIVGGTDYSATGEIIYDFVKSTNIVELDYDIAYQIYTAIMTDTGSFRFERTSPKIHKIIAELLEYGLNPTEIYNQVYDQFHFSRVKLLGEALNSIELDSTGKIAVMTLTNEIQAKHDAVEADVDGFVNYCLSIIGVQIGILIYELKDGVKVSFRSKGSITVNKLASEFGGGGHTNAAGARFFNIRINDIKNKILEAAQKYINQ